MTDFMYLRALSEVSNNDDVLEILGRSTVDSKVLIVKASIVFSKELAAIKREKDDTKKLALWKKALKDAKSLRAAATKIPPDGITDTVWRLFTKAWWSNIYNYGKAATVEKDVRNMAKNDTIDKFDKVIKYIEHNIKKLEEKET